MLIKAQQHITKISDNEEINFKNYLEGLNYITNLYVFLNNIKLAVNVKKITFQPSFKGRYTVEELGMVTTDKENEMKLFKVTSKLFLVDETVKEVYKVMKPLCEDITRLDDTIIFIMK